MNNRRIIDICESEFLSMIENVVRDIVADEVAKALSRKPDEYAGSITELSARLNVSKGTAMKAAKRISGAIERLSPRRYRYNITKIVEGNARIYS